MPSVLDDNPYKAPVRGQKFQERGQQHKAAFKAVFLQGQADRMIWEEAAHQCDCEFRRGVNDVIHQEGVPVGNYIRLDEPAAIRDLHVTPIDPKENSIYLQQEARKRARNSDELEFQQSMRQSYLKKRQMQAASV